MISPCTIVASVADLTQDTTVTLGSAATIVVALFAAAGWVHKALAKITSEMTAGMASSQSKLEDINNRLIELENDTYTKSAAAEQALRTAMENPGIRIPDPRDQSKVFHVPHRSDNQRNENQRNGDQS